MRVDERLDFNGRVAIVTGAGGGLGKEYALQLAERGALVVVNDLGGGPHGEGQSSRAADNVVNEIREKGGQAVANYDSVEDGDKIVQTAIDNYGHVDILINNAGILRDKSFQRMTNEDWDLIQKVHLRGSFIVTRAAWPHMRQNKYGRVIMTSSAAGLYGNFGQANYSSAKLGLLGLSNTLSIEGAKYNIHCNTIAPVAGSRLTATVFPPDLLEELKPEYIAPLVLYLCHDSCQENGGCYEVAAGWIGKVRLEETRGVNLRKCGKQITPESIRDAWTEITDFTNSKHPLTIQESTSNVVSVLQEAKQQNVSNATSNVKSIKDLIGFSFQPSEFCYTFRDAILYALGVGMSTSETDCLKFLYENSEDFCVLPTFSVVPAQSAFINVFSGEGSDLGEVDIDPTKILHGEHYIELMDKLPASGKLVNNVLISDVLDKGKGALLLFEVTTSDSAGRKISFNQFAVYLQGAGGFGGKRISDHQVPIVDIPDKSAPDVVIEEKTFIDQAALYRLNGDYNPLHIDPNFSKMAGLPQPIIHGLCTLGIAARHVLKRFADNDVNQFKAIKVRFSKPVVPGETIITEMWRRDNRIHVQCRIKETQEICLHSGYVDLHEVRNFKQQPVTELSSKTTNHSPEVTALFKDMQSRVSANPNLVSSVKSVFLWEIHRPDKQASSWTLDLKNGSGSVYEGEPKTSKPDCTLSLSEGDLLSMVNGKLDPYKAFLSGKLKLRGNIILSQRLSNILKTQAKL